MTLCTVSPVSTAAYYDSYWSADPTPRYEPGHELAALLERNADPGARVLDVGCGAGNSYARPIAERVACYTGVDASAAGLAVERVEAPGSFFCTVLVRRK